MTADAQKEELQDDAKKILPIYIAVDHSWSMNDDGKIDAANDLVPAIIDACIENPLADQKARFSIIGFNNEARVVAPLARGTNLPGHMFTASGTTSFTDLFKVLQNQLEADYQQLKADRFRVFRPAVFLITDGEPNCDEAKRRAAFQSLNDQSFTRRPNLSVFGVGNQVTEETAKSYTAGKGLTLVTRNGVNPGQALAEFIPVLVQSIVNSTGKLVDSSDDGDDGFEWDLDAIADDDFLVALES